MIRKCKDASGRVTDPIQQKSKNKKVICLKIPEGGDCIVFYQSFSKMFVLENSNLIWIQNEENMYCILKYI